MELDLNLCRIQPERRAQWLAFFEDEFLPYHDEVGVGRVMGHFISYRDDQGVAWFHGFRDAAERRRAQSELWGGERWQGDLGETARSLIQDSRVHRLIPADGSLLQTVDGVPSAESGWDEVMEIRLYRLRPGRRNAFARFFATRTLAPQQAAGMHVLGQFLDLEDEDRFVWLRGFPGLAERDRMKSRFYDGALWADELEHEAFDMIADYSEVWLVAPANGPGRTVNAARAGTGCR